MKKKKFILYQGRGNYKTYWLSGKVGFDKELPAPVISENNHGYKRNLNNF